MNDEPDTSETLSVASSQPTLGSSASKFIPQVDNIHPFIPGLAKNSISIETTGIQDVIPLKSHFGSLNPGKELMSFGGAKVELSYLQLCFYEIT
ncbi:hypothetical protein A0J61_08061 [Choanephora cucurbitarum]|uniref:Uncharacterized protein n=1 Tax=Choanephora cucurbitarum TaxID=101091 RepID=A0A1C7N420_9FUNG|nr:hypothetical protein A0J61_08061 [Choanephora cucurbitarum]